MKVKCTCGTIQEVKPRQDFCHFCGDPIKHLPAIEEPKKTEKPKAEKKEEKPKKKVSKSKSSSKSKSKK